jgi:hypothetical protein
LATGSASVFRDIASDNAALPYVVFDFPSEIDENRTRNRTKNAIVFVRGYAGTASVAGSIDAQIDSALHGHTLNASGWANFWTAREDSFKTVEIDEAKKKTFMRGAHYRIRADEN